VGQFEFDFLQLFQTAYLVIYNLLSIGENMPIGKYKTTTPASGAEYAFVHYGVQSSLGEIPREIYEAKGYTPPYDDLPTREEYETQNQMT
jgi:hypothetical protein